MAVAVAAESLAECRRRSAREQDREDDMGLAGPRPGVRRELRWPAHLNGGSSSNTNR